MGGGGGGGGSGGGGGGAFEGKREAATANGSLMGVWGRRKPRNGARCDAPAVTKNNANERTMVERQLTLSVFSAFYVKKLGEGHFLYAIPRSENWGRGKGWGG